MNGVTGHAPCATNHAAKPRFIVATTAITAFSALALIGGLGRKVALKISMSATVRLLAIAVAEDVRNASHKRRRRHGRAIAYC